MERELGRSGIKVSAMGAGLWAIGGPWTLGGNVAGWGEVDDNESIATVHKAIDLGINLIDTAPSYGASDSARLTGR